MRIRTLLIIVCKIYECDTYLFSFFPSGKGNMPYGLEKLRQTAPTKLGAGWALRRFSMRIPLRIGVYSRCTTVNACSSVWFLYRQSIWPYPRNEWPDPTHYRQDPPFLGIIELLFIRVNISRLLKSHFLFVRSFFRLLKGHFLFMEIFLAYQKATFYLWEFFSAIKKSLFHFWQTLLSNNKQTFIS